VLSVADIDGVRRLYELPGTATTITTNPAGLDVLVCGRPASIEAM
jgi:hypothetical protein